jgi:putative hemolysin
MYPKSKIHKLVIVLALLMYGCASAQPAPNQASLPNPASVFCEEQGGKTEIRTDAEGGQYGVCIFEDGSKCEEWTFYRGECKPGQPEPAPSPASVPAYVNETYGFSFDPPSGWTIEGYEDYLLFRRPGYQVFVGFQPAGEEPKPFRTGMPSGEFVDGGTVNLLGQPVPKQILVSNGKNKVVAYDGRIKIGDLILVIFLDAVETPEVSYDDLDIPAEIMEEADQIIASFALTSGEIPSLELNR